MVKDSPLPTSHEGVCTALHKFKKNSSVSIVHNVVSWWHSIYQLHPYDCGKPVSMFIVVHVLKQC